MKSAFRSIIGKGSGGVKSQLRSQRTIREEEMKAKTVQDYFDQVEC